MEKIVLLSSQIERDHTLIKCIKTLFPECKIEIHSQDSNTPGHNVTEIKKLPGTVDKDQKLNKSRTFL